MHARIVLPALALQGALPRWRGPPIARIPSCPRLNGLPAGRVPGRLYDLPERDGEHSHGERTCITQFQEQFFHHGWRRTGEELMRLLEEPAAKPDVRTGEILREARRLSEEMIRRREFNPA